MHLVFIVGRVPTNGWAAAGKHPLPSPPPSPLFRSSFLNPSTLTNLPSPPPPQQEVQAWIPAGVPNSNQPTGTASGGLSPFFFLPLSLFFWLCRLQPAAPACPRNTCADTHTQTHLDDSTQMHTHRLAVQSRRAKSFQAAHQSSLRSHTLPERGGVREGADD